MTEAASSTFRVTTALGMPGLTIDQDLYGTAVIVSPVG
jgi:hypothetical protein